MFKFIRRVSHSLLPRPDRPWKDDAATSNAPTIGRKRRFSVTERDDEADPTLTAAKKAKGDVPELDGASMPGEDSKSPVEGEDVKSVTQGVEGVDLDDQKDDPSSVRPEVVPLPESPVGTPQTECGSPETSEHVEPAGQQEADDEDSVASSSGQADETEQNVAPADQTTSDTETKA
ncbi:hypothetical protein F5I97DRAFT_162018 [Phlebopus sp. FC_14]|nr:hypothetical protein F5I97DRAFT_162018 [Phlebopus sp. FC_14]